jgi:hypothetical protein
MTVKRMFTAIACTLALIGTCFSQGTNAKKNNGILGYLDPKTGTFHTLPLPAAGPDTESPAPTTGKIVVSFNPITVSSSYPRPRRLPAAWWRKSLKQPHSTSSTRKPA